MNLDYYNNIIEKSYAHPEPYHQYKYPIPHEYNQNSNSSTSYVKGPYGVSFDEDKQLKQNNKKKYK